MNSGQHGREVVSGTGAVTEILLFAIGSTMVLQLGAVAGTDVVVEGSRARGNDKIVNR